MKRTQRAWSLLDILSYYNHLCLQCQSSPAAHEGTPFTNFSNKVQQMGEPSVQDTVCSVKLFTLAHQLYYHILLILIFSTWEFIFSVTLKDVTQATSTFSCKTGISRFFGLVKYSRQTLDGHTESQPSLTDIRQNNQIITLFPFSVRRCLHSEWFLWRRKIQFPITNHQHRPAYLDVPDEWKLQLVGVVLQVLNNVSEVFKGRNTQCSNRILIYVLAVLFSLMVSSLVM